MVVVTLESTTKEDIKDSTTDLKLEPHVSAVQQQCIVSKTMLHTHRRTPSPDKILFLHNAQQHDGALAAPEAKEEPSRKRPANMEDNNDEELKTGMPCIKKARFIVLAPIAAVGQQENTPRTVHFELHQNNQTAVIKTTVRIFDRVQDCDVANTWWSADEMLEIMSREKSAISVMSYCCEHYTSEVLNCMKMARNRKSLPGKANEESSSPLWVANSPARGLERDIVQGFKQRKRQVIRKVLESQRVLRLGRHHITGECAPAELQSQVLSSQYQKWSHPMVRFAQVLAEGDAQVVIDNAAAAPATVAAPTPPTVEAH